MSKNIYAHGKHAQLIHKSNTVLLFRRNARLGMVDVVVMPKPRQSVRHHLHYINRREISGCLQPSGAPEVVETITHNTNRLVFAPRPKTAEVLEPLD